ncbi:AcrR family transcriptional regulator [Sinomonas atrocyanea]|jgi:AcrR family transcriptional regulator|uniref:TetR/AcrR family transcriptional regulator n=1 Tax=Sinomonas atrocyanea TaxID=37927 RepID=UPI00278260D0|nr:TetR/AcrR family transcriptional regulator [Sinomonas atrocyanea]MDP9884665.1 AcrR family transcriptional regulator [Sinomonas atrocyanea]
MARPPRPERKYELLDQILDHLLDSTLADLTFRSLADALGISSYVLVYHFGNREQLVTEIIRGIMRRLEPLTTLRPASDSPEDVVALARRAFELGLDHRGRHLQRLEFEASVQDVVADDPRRPSAESLEHWCGLLAKWLRGRGLPPRAARSMARTYVGAVMGLLYEFVLSGDRHAALDSFDVLADGFVAHLDRAAHRIAS